MWLRIKIRFPRRAGGICLAVKHSGLGGGSLCVNQYRPAQGAYCLLFSDETWWMEAHERAFVSLPLQGQRKKVILVLIS